MKTGDKLRVCIDSTWLTGVVTICSANGRSIAVDFDEGVPAPFWVNGTKQSLLLLKEEDGRWYDIACGHEIAVEGQITNDDGSLIITREMRGLNCPHCGKALPDATVAVEDPVDAIPAEGSLGICAYCASALKFTLSGLVFATEADWDECDAESRKLAEDVIGPLQFRGKP